MLLSLDNDELLAQIEYGALRPLSKRQFLNPDSWEFHFSKPMSLCVLNPEYIKVLVRREEKGAGDKEGKIDRLHTKSRSITFSNRSAQFEKT